MTVTDRLPLKNYQDNQTVVGLFAPFDGYISDIDVALADPLPIADNYDYYGQILGYGPFWPITLDPVVKRDIILSGAVRWKGTEKGLELITTASGITIVGYYYHPDDTVFVIIDETNAPPWSFLFRFLRDSILPFIKPTWVKIDTCYSGFIADYSSAGDPVGPL